MKVIIPKESTPIPPVPAPGQVFSVSYTNGNYYVFLRGESASDERSFLIYKRAPYTGNWVVGTTAYAPWQGADEVRIYPDATLVLVPEGG